ncbi:MAG TPA: haloacid dehalogenase type II [Thermomicrobiales bacterium]|nr:haloacid dehalogenase type II [Thermomicrobiales bacterium]
MPEVIVFDVNETLLDVGALDPFFEDRFGNAGVRREWFGQMLQSAFVTTITGDYHDFGALAMGALTMVASRHGVTLSDADRKELGASMRGLPPHPDVRPAMERLRDAGFRLASLTNSTLEVARAQLENAELMSLLEAALSADTVHRLKPAPEPYRMAAETLGVEIRDLRLVAAHSWDVAGALSAGCAATFVARPGQVLDPAIPEPDMIASDIAGVAERLIARNA